MQSASFSCNLPHLYIVYLFGFCHMPVTRVMPSFQAVCVECERQSMGSRAGGPVFELKFCLLLPIRSVFLAGISFPHL